MGQRKRWRHPPAAAGHRLRLGVSRRSPAAGTAAASTSEALAPRRCRSPGGAAAFGRRQEKPSRHERSRAATARSPPPRAPERVGTLRKLQAQEAEGAGAARCAPEPGFDGRRPPPQRRTHDRRRDRCPATATHGILWTSPRRARCAGGRRTSGWRRLRPRPPPSLDEPDPMRAAAVRFLQATPPSDREGLVVVSLIRRISCTEPPYQGSVGRRDPSFTGPALGAPKRARWVA